MQYQLSFQLNLQTQVLEGEGTRQLANTLKSEFGKLARMRPAATRSESREMYLVCKQRLCTT